MPGLPYRLAPGEIRLQGDKIVIPGLVIQSDGTIRLSGEIGRGPPPGQSPGPGRKTFLLIDRGGNEVWTNGYINLKGPLSALVATGHLTVPKAQFRPTFFRPAPMEPDVILVPVKPQPQAEAIAAPAIYRNLRVDITLENSGNAWLVDRMGKVEMIAHLKIRKTRARNWPWAGRWRPQRHPGHRGPHLHRETGCAADARRGRQAHNHRGQALHEMDDITLVLTVNGTMSNPKIRLESMPPLPPADVLSYLVFGAPSATLTKEQYMALGAQQLGVLGG